MASEGGGLKRRLSEPDAKGKSAKRRKSEDAGAAAGAGAGAAGGAAAAGEAASSAAASSGPAVGGGGLGGGGSTAAAPGGGGIGANKAERDAELEERQRLTALLGTFSQEQMERYEAFRRSHFDKNKVKKLIQRVAGVDTVSNEMAVALGGIAKIFAGELIELARQDMNDFKGAIHPLHIRNAYRKLRQAGKIPYLPAPPHGLID